MKKSIKALILLLLVLLMLFGLGIMAYPIFSSKYAEKVRSQVQTQYEEALNHSDIDIDAIKAEAIQYNKKLFTGEISVVSSESIRESGYWEQLVLSGTKVMCYIRIPKIDINLPVYHGIGEDALRAGCGHMPQTSLPIGGENTHSVISAHTGMASSAMFSDLPLLNVGDRFYIDVLGETLTYEVYKQPETVLPQESEHILLQKGEDLCTLVTCVPYGINTHRLLVYGKRVPTTADSTISVEAPQPSDSEKFSIYESEYRKSVTIGIILIAVLFIIAITIVTILVIKSKQGGKPKEVDQHEKD